ncbi:GNAT family N-acetyltransferase [Bacillus sp. ISL-40]|uniref:GNAT family N-acetyltransferase n=1 Tax=unclassified Bacillus (in: firmicutes) TaxID=185979 RepID=UPI001BEAD5EF|nr:MULTISPECIES: GNAT family N-acetyltransferase [unclassified Bacillus (in: firmicutes)]MBT2699895.1 GNAT family N-acetyltransferase [Bacillus sp. ISL-40]MBT2743800.1 GNAT family N-acetyltransferase [Bacillus sp. ISL-77]
MIRKLTDQDHEQVLAFLSEEPSINLFIIGDIEAFGYTSESQEIWAEFDEQSTIKAVLLRFHQSFIPYAKGEFDTSGFVSIMKNYSQPILLSGKSDIVAKFEAFDDLQLGKKQVTYFAECRTDECLSPDEVVYKRASLEDVDQILQLRQTIEEFHVRSDARDVLVQSLEANTSRTYFTEENGVLTSCVSTAAENSISAMIVGVCTRKEYRRNGLATSIMQNLFQDVLDEGKTLCLFYDNPEAGRIYKRLGFKEIGMWTMHR